jgi:hypothetical protein
MALDAAPMIVNKAEERLELDGIYCVVGGKTLFGSGFMKFRTIAS